MNKKLEFELEYDPGKEELVLIDYSTAKNDKPIRLTFKGVSDIDKFKLALTAWIELINAS